MKIFSSKRTQRAVVTSALMLTVAAGGIGAGLYMNSTQSQETRSSAGEDSTCVPGETEVCNKMFGTCSAIGKKTCSAGATWGLCKADDPRIQNCFGKNCGDDGCGGVCGLCSAGSTCGADGKCSGTTTNISGETFPEVGGTNLQAKIILQIRSDHTKDAIRLELIQGETVIASEEVSSGADGVTKAWDISTVGLGSYSLRVKPQGYLSQAKTITLTSENGVVEFTEEFLAGDIVGGDDVWGDDVVKSNDLAYLNSVSLTADTRADFDGDGYVKARDRAILEGNLLKVGSSVE